MGESADLLYAGMTLAKGSCLVQICYADSREGGQDQKHMKATQDHQKKWADAKGRPLKFAVGDHVFLKISPTRVVIRFGCSGKLSPRYIGLFDIIERVGEVAYR